jgi:hypothetical protein
MTQFESNPYAANYQPQPPAGAARPTSGLAITSLVLSLIFCCPLTTLLGLILGTVAIASTGPRAPKKGRGLGIAAVIISLIFTAGQAAFIVWAMDIYSKMMNAPQVVLQAGFAGDWNAFRSNLHPVTGRTFTDQQAAAFIEELRARYGEFQSSRMNEQAMQGRNSGGRPDMDIPYLVVFDSGQLDAEAQFIFADQNTGQFVFKIGSITIKDPAQGDITFPPPGSAPAPVGGATPPSSPPDVNQPGASPGDGN